MAEESAQAEAKAAAPKGGSGRLLAIVGIVVVVGGGGAAVWYLRMLPGRNAEAKQETTKETRPTVGAFLPLEPFIANLADEDGKRYLKTSVQLEFFTGKIPDEFNARTAQIRDLLLTLFTSKQYSEIRTPQGKALLRDEIINRINRALNRDVVKAVYFTEFIVQ